MSHENGSGGGHKRKASELDAAPASDVLDAPLDLDAEAVEAAEAAYFSRGRSNTSATLPVLDQTRAEGGVRRRMLLVAKSGKGAAPELVTGSSCGPFGDVVYASGAGAADAGVPPPLFEVRRHQRRTTSWFFRDQVVREGGMWTLTSADPAFALMNLLERESRQGQGQRRTASDLLASAPLLRPYEELMPLLCDVTEAGDDRFYGFSRRKCVAYARVKHAKLLKSCAVLHAWYRAAESSGAYGSTPAPAPTPEADEATRSLHVLHLLHEYLPSGVFEGLCSSLAVDTAEFKRSQGVCEKDFHATMVSRDIDLGKTVQDEEEAKKKKLLSTASLAVKRTLKQGSPTGNMS
eukprot:Rhum_TRINITY_DN7687_c0_g1::Rhum_TRINITY_DN7687_c0_g1_i1::g.24165::m.24165/K10744/RNASEH2B; ribonuclease H2 subunit B